MGNRFEVRRSVAVASEFDRGDKARLSEFVGQTVFQHEHTGPPAAPLDLNEATCHSFVGAVAITLFAPSKQTLNGVSRFQEEVGAFFFRRRGEGCGYGRGTFYC
jgi:hypothetical protein